MRSHAASVAEPSLIRRVWIRFSDYAIVLILLFALIAVCFGVYNGWVAKNNSAVAEQAALAAKATAEKSLIAQRHNHAQNVASQGQIKQLLDELKQSAAAIEYEGGVIVYQNAELKNKDDAIIAAQAAGHAMLTAVAGLQMEINQDVPELRLGLNNGQAQINAAIRFDTCLGLNPTNTAVCGAVPPLPPTS